MISTWGAGGQASGCFAANKPRAGTSVAELTFSYLVPKQDTDMKDTEGKPLFSLFRLDLFIYSN